MDRLAPHIICPHDLTPLRAEPWSAAFVVTTGPDGLTSGPPYVCPHCEQVFSVRRNDERAVVSLIEPPHRCPQPDTDANRARFFGA